MARAKRPLAEVDVNIATSRPASKKRSSGSDREKEKSVSSDYEKKTVAELSALLKERSLPSNGKKADLVRRLRDDDAIKCSQNAAKVDLASLAVSCAYFRDREILASRQPRLPPLR